MKHNYKISQFCRKVALHRRSYQRSKNLPHKQGVKGKIYEPYMGILEQAVIEWPYFGYRKIWAITRQKHTMSMSSVRRALQHMGLMLGGARRKKVFPHKRKIKVYPTLPFQTIQVDLVDIDIMGYKRHFAAVPCDYWSAYPIKLHFGISKSVVCLFCQDTFPL